MAATPPNCIWTTRPLPTEMLFVPVRHHFCGDSRLTSAPHRPNAPAYRIARQCFCTFGPFV